jgi:hypothetical protein
MHTYTLCNFDIQCALRMHNFPLCNFDSQCLSIKKTRYDASIVLPVFILFFIYHYYYFIIIIIIMLTVSLPWARPPEPAAGWPVWTVADIADSQHNTYIRTDIKNLNFCENSSTGVQLTCLHALNKTIDLYRMDSLYRASTCACIERGKHRSYRQIYIYIAAGLGNKKISFPSSPHHPSYNKRWLSIKGASAISPMQWRTCINVLRRGGGL